MATFTAVQIEDKIQALWNAFFYLFAVCIAVFLMTGRNNLLPFTVQDDTQVQLSWQSALWAVAAIALTNISDLPTKTGGYPSTLSFYLKSSPFVCIFSVMGSLAQIAVAVTKEGPIGGFGTALKFLADEKFNVDEVASITERPVRMTLFILGAVPQVIKLFACTGVLSTQILATCYLLGFFLDELCLWCMQRHIAQAASDESPSVPVHYATDPFSSDKITSDFIFVVSGFLFDTLWPTRIIFAFSRRFSLDDNPLLVAWLGLLFGLAFTLTFLCVPRNRFKRGGISFSLKFTTRKDRELSALMKIWAPGFTAFIVRIWASMYEEVFLAKIFKIAYEVIFVVVELPCMIYLTARDFSVVEAGSFPRIASFAVNVFSLTMFFATFYDASQSYRPGWIEWLG